MPATFMEPSPQCCGEPARRQMDLLLSQSDFRGRGHYEVSKRPNRLTTAPRLCGTPLRTGVARP